MTTYTLILFTVLSQELSAVLAGIEVPTAVVLKGSVFLDVTKCNPLKVNRRFRGTYRFHLQDGRINQARNQLERVNLLIAYFNASFLLVFFFDFEERCDMFLRNVGWFATDYTELYPRYSLKYIG
jgi:hypothetical protein